MARMHANFIHDPARGVVFAYVPKVACTNWKSLMRYMAGHEDWLDNRLAHDRERGGLHYLVPENPAGAALLARPDVAKYAMVRDPYARVLSAYLNKVENRLPPRAPEPGQDSFHDAVRAIEAFRAAHLAATHPDIDFEVFLRWLRDSGDARVDDEHWTPQAVLLRQPGLRFDMIGRLETLEQDAPAMLRAMGCDRDFPTQKEVNFAPTDAQGKLGRYYTPATRALVEEIFAMDFDAFGYPRRDPVTTPVPVAPVVAPAAAAQPVPARPVPAQSTPARPRRTPPTMAGRTYVSRTPLKPDSLAILRDLDIAVGTVLDVGVQTVTEELIQAFPDRPHLLIEPVEEYHAAILRRYGREGIEHRLAPVAAADTDGESDLVVRTIGGGDAITHSRLADDKVPGAQARTRRVLMRRLDTLVVQYEARPPYLLKIDVDGAELRVLAGATETLRQTNVVVIEAQIRNAFERAAPLVAAGFELFDIVDLCYHEHRLSQFDMIFVKKATLEAEGKSIFAKGFNPKAWFKLQAGG